MPSGVMQRHFCTLLWTTLLKSPGKHLSLPGLFAFSQPN